MILNTWLFLLLIVLILSSVTGIKHYPIVPVAFVTALFFSLCGLQNLH